MVELNLNVPINTFYINGLRKFNTHKYAVYKKFTLNTHPPNIKRKRWKRQYVKNTKQNNQQKPKKQRKTLDWLN